MDRVQNSIASRDCVTNCGTAGPDGHGGGGIDFCDRAGWGGWYQANVTSVTIYLCWCGDDGGGIRACDAHLDAKDLNISKCYAGAQLVDGNFAQSARGFGRGGCLVLGNTIGGGQGPIFTCTFLLLDHGRSFYRQGLMSAFLSADTDTWNGATVSNSILFGADDNDYILFLERRDIRMYWVQFKAVALGFRTDRSDGLVNLWDCQIEVDPLVGFQSAGIGVSDRLLATQSIEMDRVCSEFYYLSRPAYGCPIVKQCTGIPRTALPNATPQRTAQVLSCPPSYYEGGFWNWRCESRYGNFELFHVYFKDCAVNGRDQTLWAGGGISLRDSERAWVEDCAFVNCRAQDHAGGIQYRDTRRATFLRCCLTSCVSLECSGGGLRTVGGQCILELRSCLFYKDECCWSGGACDLMDTGGFGASDTNMTACMAVTCGGDYHGGGAWFLNVDQMLDLDYIVVHSTGSYSSSQKGAIRQNQRATTVATIISNTFFIESPPTCYSVWAESGSLRLVHCYFRSYGLGFRANPGPIYMQECFVDTNETIPAGVVVEGASNVFTWGAVGTAVTNVCSEYFFWQDQLGYDAASAAGCRAVSFCSRDVQLIATRSPFASRSPIAGMPTRSAPAIPVATRSPIVRPGGTASPVRSALARPTPTNLPPGTQPQQTWQIVPTDSGNTPKAGAGGKSSNTGVIVGSIVGVVAALAIIAVLLWLFVFKDDGEENADGAEGARETVQPAGVPTMPASTAGYATQENPIAGGGGMVDEDF